MTTATTSDARASSDPEIHAPFSGVLGSEWTKLTTVRSTVWTLLATAVVGIGLGAIVTSAQASRWATRSLASSRHTPVANTCWTALKERATAEQHPGVIPSINTPDGCPSTEIRQGVPVRTPTPHHQPQETIPS